MHASFALSLSLLAPASQAPAAVAAHATQATAVSIPWQRGDESVPLLPAAEATLQLITLLQETQQRHFVVAFAPDQASRVRESLIAAGIRVLSPLGRGAFIASVPTLQHVTALPPGGPGLHIAPIPSSTKRHLAFDDGDCPPWALKVDEAGQRVIALVVPFEDANVRLVADHLTDIGANVRGVLEEEKTIIVDVVPGGVESLVEVDDVQWVEPPLPRLVGGNYEAAVASGALSVQGSHGLTGQGVKVMVYDIGHVWPDRTAFHVSASNTTSRVTIQHGPYTFDPSDPVHPSHVAGTIAGNGADSPGPGHAGMAPNATIESYAFSRGGDNVAGDLYTDPRDLKDKFYHAFDIAGCNVANTSMSSSPWSWAQASTSLSCGWFGDYGVTAALLDNMIDESAAGPARRRLVWIAGNSGQGGLGATCSSGYGTIDPPGTAKNVITVGASR